MRRTLVLLLMPLVFAALAVAQNNNGKALDIYVVDVEGGNAVLFVTPGGESVLIERATSGQAPRGMPAGLRMRRKMRR